MVNSLLRTSFQFCLSLGLGLSLTIGSSRLSHAQSEPYIQLLQSYCGPDALGGLRILRTYNFGNPRPSWEVSQWFQACSQETNWMNWLTDYSEDIAAAEYAFDLPGDYLSCLIWTESGFNPNAASQIAEPALGLAQIQAPTARYLNRLLNDSPPITDTDWNNLRAQYPEVTNRGQVTTEQLIAYYRGRLADRSWRRGVSSGEFERSLAYYEGQLSQLIERQALQPMWKRYLKARGMPETTQIPEDLRGHPDIAVGVSALYVRLILMEMDQAYHINDHLTRPARMDELFQAVTAIYNRGHNGGFRSIALARTNDIGEWIELSVDGSAERRQQVYQAAQCMSRRERPPLEDPRCCKQPPYPENASFPIDWDVVDKIKTQWGCPR